MPFGTLTPEMEARIAPLVNNKTVWDLGAGDLSYAKRLLHLGAPHVVAVDKAIQGTPPKDIQVIEAYFDEITTTLLPEHIEIAFLSWPANRHMPGLQNLLDRSHIVIYLGSNTNGTACGTPNLIRTLASRSLLDELPHPRNSLLIYGPRLTQPRTLAGEEIAALSGQLITFEEAQRLATETRP